MARLPTDFEQLMLELVNRLRIDPQGEYARLVGPGAPADVMDAVNFFGVSLSALQSQLAALAARSPLAWNSALADAAQSHNQAMIAADEQSHQTPGEPSLGDRARNAGYTFSTLGENVYAFAANVFHGHAGFVIDWGYDSEDFEGSQLKPDWRSLGDGIQDPPGHRNSLMSANFTEIGIAVTLESNSATKVGPMVITQDLGNRFDYTAQFLGVVIDDRDGDDFYDIGEGLGGVTITLVNGPSSFTTTSWASGGYQITVPAGTYTVTFSGGALGQSVVKTATIGLANVKLDAKKIAVSNTPTEGPDTITGTADSDQIASLGGDDNVSGLGGDDRLDGGDGNDTLNGGPGDDALIGGAGADTAVFGHASGLARLVLAGGGLFVSGPEGADFLQDIETLQFADGSVAVASLGPALSDALVDDAWYLAHYPDVRAAGVDADFHYATDGWREGRNPNGFFSTAGYLAVNPDVRAAGVNPLLHYDHWGWREGRDPGPGFDTGIYLARNPDVARAGMNPLIHYLEYGIGEGRTAFKAVGPLSDAGFDRQYYLMTNPDVAASGMDPYRHFLDYGWCEHRDPNALFDTSFYLETYRDVAAAGVDPLLHYDSYGWREGRDPGAGFDTSFYLQNNRDVAAAGINPLHHFLSYGAAEGRTAAPPPQPASSAALFEPHQAPLSSSEEMWMPLAWDPLHVSEPAAGL